MSKEHDALRSSVNLDEVTKRMLDLGSQKRERLHAFPDSPPQKEKTEWTQELAEKAMEITRPKDSD